MMDNVVWKLGVNFSFEKDKVVIKNLLDSRSFKIKSNHFIKILDDISEKRNLSKLEQSGLVESNTNRNLNIEQGFEHWEKRRWVPSIDLYLASRNVVYSDIRDNVGKVRKEISKTYGELPARNLPQSFVKQYGPLESTEKVSVNLDEFLYSLKERRSVRKFKTQKVSKNQFFSILSNGSDKIRRTRKHEKENFLFSYGSAFEIYILIYNVEDLIPGVYYYNIENNFLNLVREEELKDIMPNLMAHQPFSCTAAYTLFIVANFDLYQWRYRHERGLRNLYIEAGRVMQGFLIESMIQGVDGVVTPALKDTVIANILELNNLDSLPIYSYTCGIK